MAQKKHSVGERTALLVGLMLALFPLSSKGQTTLGSQTLSLNLQKAGYLYSVPSSLALIQAGNIFNAYAGSMSLTYRARTSSGGSGAITAKATADFAPSGGPSVGSPPSAGDTLTYTCGGTSDNNFTPCSGAITVSTASATNVVSIGANACTGGGAPCSSVNPNTVTLSFILTNDPKYKTGSYSATITFTISAT
jgi:hypothetical protein